MQIKLIFTTKVFHIASFWKWEILELGNGLLYSQTESGSGNSERAWEQENEKWKQNLT